MVETDIRRYESDENPTGIHASSDGVVSQRKNLVSLFMMIFSHQCIAHSVVLKMCEYSRHDSYAIYAATDKGRSTNCNVIGHQTARTAQDQTCFYFLFSRVNATQIVTSKISS